MLSLEARSASRASSILGSHSRRLLHSLVECFKLGDVPARHVGADFAGVGELIYFARPSPDGDSGNAVALGYLLIGKPYVLHFAYLDSFVGPLNAKMPRPDSFLS